MEQKTIGKFITALRKANGMTQKDLAEKLNVSDKTISRWERDEWSPDLSMIPILAEIFEVTCDELLRGERKSPEERAEVEVNEEITPKAEKQRKRILKVTLSQYRSRTFISIGISVAGLIVALIGNLAFLNAVLGGLLGAVFYVSSAICQMVFLNRAFLSVEDAELDEESLSEFKHSVIRLAEQSVGVSIAFFGFSFPLILVDAYLGLGTDSLLLFGGIGAAIFLVLYAVILYFLNASLLKNGVYTLQEKEAERYHYNHRLQRNCAFALMLILALTFVVHQMATTLWGPGSIMEGTTFHDYESFIAYMEQEIPYDPWMRDTIVLAPEPVEDALYAEIGTVYYDEYGNEITEEQARKRQLEDKNGNIVCEYIDRNESVCSIRYSPKDGTVLPITVCTYEDLEDAETTVAVRHVMFGVAYVVETMAVILFYLRKRQKVSQ